MIEPERAWYTTLKPEEIRVLNTPRRKRETVEEFLARGGEIERFEVSRLVDPTHPEYSRWKPKQAYRVACDCNHAPHLQSCASFWKRK